MNKLVVMKKMGDINILNFSFNEINLEEYEQLKKELNDLLWVNEVRFVLDLSNVGFLSSLLIATIVFFAKEVRANKGEVKLLGLSTEAQSVLQITQLDKIFETYDTEHDVLESFKKTT